MGFVGMGSGNRPDVLGGRGSRIRYWFGYRGVLANSLLTLVPTPGGIGAVDSGVGGVAVRLSSLTATAAATLVLIDRAITYVSVIVLGGLLFVARQIVRGSQAA